MTIEVGTMEIEIPKADHVTTVIDEVFKDPSMFRLK